MLYYDVCFMLYYCYLFLLITLLIQLYNLGYLSSYPKIIWVNLMINNYVFDFGVKRNWRIYKWLLYMSERICSFIAISTHLKLVVDLSRSYSNWQVGIETGSTMIWTPVLRWQFRKYSKLLFYLSRKELQKQLWAIADPYCKYNV